MSTATLNEQDFGRDPLKARDTDHYQKEYVQSFVEKWDELIDWEARARSEGEFFVQILKARDKHKILDVATGTGFHSVQLMRAGFDVTSVDGNSEMLTKAFENGRDRDVILQTVHADWRWLNKDVHGKFDAIVCLGNSFTHLFDERDRRRACLFVAIGPALDPAAVMRQFRLQRPVAEILRRRQRDTGLRKAAAQRERVGEQVGRVTGARPCFHG